ncbi:unnamed protein product, partial [Darwinula stevensoni]
QPITLQPHLTLNPQVRDYALQALDLSDKNYTVLVPGAEYGPAKRWPAAHFAKLAALIGQDIVLLGSTKEYDLCQEIEQLALSSNPQNTDLRIHNIAGKTTLDSALAVISGAQAVISNDSGLMHVAAALQVPQIAVFGSSSPLHTPPLSEKAHILWLAQDTKYTPALECAPCFARICPLGHTRCLQDLSPQRVFFLLFDDIATLLDDVATMTKVAAKKTTGVLGDDLALNAQQVTGVNADRELPVVWAVAKGSLINKAILVPVALLISKFAPWAIIPLLMLGGLYLCFEGFEKIVHKLMHSKAQDAAHHAKELAAVADDKVDMVAFEKDKIKGAIRTDFILSAEI